MKSIQILILLLVGLPLSLSAQFVYGDLLPDAPALAARGAYNIGVQTMTITNPDQLNLLEANGDETPTYDRDLALEVWYPTTGEMSQQTTVYEEVMGTSGDTARPLIPFTFLGRAVRDAAPLVKAGPFPLIIISHGYVGSRYLMTYLADNLATKGYVVAAIDHKESTFRDAGPFHSTLYYRSLDVLFTLDEMDRLSKAKDHFLNGLVDASQTGIIGYSMGGYGVLNVGGAGYSQRLAGFFGVQTKGCTAINRRCMGDPAYPSSPDARIKAIVAFAPWGKNYEAWDEAGLQGLQIPTLFIAGSDDDISGYENGIKAIFDGATKVEKYMLTYQGARHNVAPNPAPPEALQPGLHLDEYLRYADSVWDSRRMNNINQHFITALMGIKLKGQTELAKYLDLTAEANNSWEGFKPRTAVGLRFDR
ncbi:MAG: dienelactone hydrolase [Bacteroidota bacterium]